MNTFSGQEVNTSVESKAGYTSAYTYDKNGNLKTLERDAPRLLIPNDLNSEDIAAMD